MADGIVAVAAALPVELSGIRRLGAFERAAASDIAYMRGGVRGTEAALFVSGIGYRRAYETAKAACALLRPAIYVSVGLSGALDASLTAGDVVIGERVSTGGEAYDCDRGLLNTLKNAFKGMSGISFGNLYAAERVLVRAEEKRALAASCNCLAVDMETGGAARAAREAGVPFIAIRAISDTLDADLPVDFNRFYKAGGLDWPRLVAHVLTHPGAVAPLVRLGRDSRLAAANLADAVGALFEAGIKM